VEEVLVDLELVQVDLEQMVFLQFFQQLHLQVVDMVEVLIVYLHLKEVQVVVEVEMVEEVVHQVELVIHHQ
jgi:hypothetical protein